jgi:hypothetical protein
LLSLIHGPVVIQDGSEALWDEQFIPIVRHEKGQGVTKVPQVPI